MGTPALPVTTRPRPSWPVAIRVAVPLVNSCAASVLPFWILLQSRDFIKSLQLFSALGLVVAALTGGAPPAPGANRPALQIAADAYRSFGLPPRSSQSAMACEHPFQHPYSAEPGNTLSARTTVGRGMKFTGFLQQRRGPDAKVGSMPETIPRIPRSTALIRRNACLPTVLASALSISLSFADPGDTAGDKPPGDLVAVMQGDKDESFVRRVLAYKTFSPDGRLFAGYYRDGWDEIISIHDSASGKQLKRISGHGDEVTAFRFTPDGSILASCNINRGREGWALWDVATGELLMRLPRTGKGEEHGGADKPADTLRHVLNWDRLRIGMTEETVITLLGKPLKMVEGPSSSGFTGPPMLFWGDFPEDPDEGQTFVETDFFRVVFADDGTVKAWHRPDNASTPGKKQ